MINAQKESRKSIMDLASESLILILQLRSTIDYGDAENLKSRAFEMFERFEDNSRRAGIDNEKIRLSKFALVAFLDETIISSEWPQKAQWLSDPLQIKLFDTFNAGEEFFNYMAELRLRSSQNKEVLEIYYLCLSLGFKGKYQLQSPENLRRIIDDLNIELHPDAFRSIDIISPNGKPRQSLVQTVKGGLPLWVYPLSALVIFVLIYVVFSFVVSGETENVVSFLRTLNM
ncbi:MAG: type IVB secretion system protein IcmH/DotU [Ignavibacteriaceae bacterium]|nr:type IVB secretion system protein IcmH/DotU [Ignavibacteriaceae bacterium]MCW9064664.1 type IVB secretion system protein IcmH/DotU [Ignavibacteriaceae bacterium]